jgi:Uma2 family endonuclease
MAKTLVAERHPNPSKAAVLNIPENLVYEVLNGKPIYFRDYKSVLNHEKTLDDVMATGRLQTLIINAVQEHLILNHRQAGLKYLSNEVRIHISLNSNFSCDLAAIDKTLLAASEDDTKYYNFPPEFVIEVDTNGDFSDSAFESYLFEKSRKLLDFGVKKVFWILTASQTVTIGRFDSDIWTTQLWHKPIEIFEGHPLILQELFLENGIKLPNLPLY